MTLTPEQHAERLKGIGGSDAAAVLGLSKFKTQRQLYHEKRGEYPVDLDSPENEFIWWGRALEPIVRQKYAEKVGRTVRVPTHTLRHPEHDFMLANIDGFTIEEFAEVEIEPAYCRGYEGKTAYLSTGWGEEGTDQIPQEYLLQVHHYMTVTGFPAWDVCSLIGRHFAYYHIKHDLELSQMLIEAEREFWARVRAGEPPPFDYQHKTAIDVVKKLHPGTNGARLVATEDAIGWRRRLEKAQRIEKLCKARIDGYKTRILEEMGDAALLAFPDGRCYRRQVVERSAYSVEATSYVDARFINDGKAPALKRGRK
jgi:putative phage-type endonuclease